MEKIERSHRNDNERFYSFLNFYSLEELIKQETQYLKRSNNIPMQVNTNWNETKITKQIKNNSILRPSYL